MGLKELLKTKPSLEWQQNTAQPLYGLNMNPDYTQKPFK